MIAARYTDDAFIRLLGAQIGQPVPRAADLEGADGLQALGLARDDAHRAELEATQFKGKKVDVGRFKGLGEMNTNQLKETTMDRIGRAHSRTTETNAHTV